MIVLHQDDGIFAVGFGADGFGKALVHRTIGGVVLAAELRPRMREVAQRPQPFVGEAIVIAALLFLGQPDAPQQVAVVDRGTWWHAQVTRRVRRLAIGRAAAMRDPHARTGAHHRLNRRHQTAGRMQHLDVALAVAVVDVRLAIGEQQHALALHILLQDLAQARWTPASLLPLGIALAR